MVLSLYSRACRISARMCSQGSGILAIGCVEVPEETTSTVKCLIAFAQVIAQAKYLTIINDDNLIYKDKNQP